MQHFNTADTINTKNLTALSVDSIEFKDRSKGVTTERTITFRLGDMVYTLVAKDEEACYAFEKKLKVVKELTGNGNLLTNKVFKELLEFAEVVSVMVDTVHFTIGNGLVPRDNFPNRWVGPNTFNQPNIIGNGGGITTKSDPNYMLCGGAR